MRDEDLKNLPQSIEGWRIAELLSALGITEHRNVREMHVYPTEVQVTVLATGEDGRRLWREIPRDIEVTDLSDAEPSYVAAHPDREPMVHEISIPIVQVRANPANDVRCPARRNLGPTGRCTKFENHTGDHSYPDCEARKGPLSGTTPVCTLAADHPGLHDAGGGVRW